MNNQKIINFTREQLKQGLSQCSSEQQLLFKRMYSHQNLELPINEVVDNMPNEKLDWALTQVEKTLAKLQPHTNSRFEGGL